MCNDLRYQAKLATLNHFATQKNVSEIPGTSYHNKTFSSINDLNDAINDCFSSYVKSKDIKLLEECHMMNSYFYDLDLVISRVDYHLNNTEERIYGSSRGFYIYLTRNSYSLMLFTFSPYFLDDSIKLEFMPDIKEFPNNPQILNIDEALKLY